MSDRLLQDIPDDDPGVVAFVEALRLDPAMHKFDQAIRQAASETRNSARRTAIIHAGIRRHFHFGRVFHLKDEKV